MIKVMKFGGTSVGSAENMRKVADIVRSEGANVTVLSAMSGTTDALIRVCALAKGKKYDEIPIVLENLIQKYTTCIKELLSERVSEVLDKMNEVFALIEKEVENYTCCVSDKIILAQGEWLTTFVFTEYLKELGAKTALLNAPDFMWIGENGKFDMDHLNACLPALASDPDTHYITQGFICRNSNGELDNLGRGGSDYSAALMGVSVGADEVQIWTDIDGMRNNDPRYVEKTYPIRHISFDDAAELAYFGAKILHPATIQPCKVNGIPVRLKNTLDPSASGTLITTEGEPSEFCAVAAKDKITVVRIHSLRMLMAYGFLRKVFEVFEEHKTPIDMITTSEVAVSLTIDNDEHLVEILEDLKPFGTVEVERDNTIICIVGDLDYHKSGLLARITDSLNSIPVKMISYGASHRNLVLLIDTENKINALRRINHELFKL